MRFEFIACKYTSFIQYRKMIEYFFVRVKENLAKNNQPCSNKAFIIYQPLIYILPPSSVYNHRYKVRHVFFHLHPRTIR